MVRRTSTIKVDGDTRVLRAEFNKGSATVKSFGSTMQGAAQSAALVQGPLGGVSSRISTLASITRTANPILIASGAAIAGITATLWGSVRAFDEYERQQLKIEQLVRATGGAAGLTAGELAQMADEVGLMTLASVDEIQQAIGVLQTFRTVQGDTFREAIVLAQDMAAVFGGTAADKALQLGKALESPTDGLTALKRSGVSFSQAERDMIRALQESGDLFAAQGIIIEKIRDQLGGSGAAAAGGLAGSIDTTSQRWEELLRSLGKTTGVASFTESALNGVSDMLRELREAIDPTIAGLEAQLAKMQERLESSSGVVADLIRQRMDEVRQQLLEARAESGDAAAIQTLMDQIDAQLQANADPSVGGFLADIFGTESSTDALLARREALEAQLQQLDQQRTASIATQKEIQAQIEADAETKAAELAEKEAERVQKLEESNQRILDQQQARYDRLHEQALAAQGRDVELENFRHQRELERLQEELQRLEEHGLASEAIRQAHREAVENAEAAHQARLTDIATEEAEKRKDTEKEIAEARMAIGEGLLEFGQAFFEQDSKAQRALLVLQRAAALNRARIALQEAIAQANALPWPANIPAIAKAVSIGGSAIANIASIDVVAHGGLTNSPREMTAWIDADERILSPRQNQDFTALVREMRNGSLMSPTSGGASYKIYGAPGEEPEALMRRMVREGVIPSELNAQQIREGAQPIFKGN
jgi:hypothetical protein